MKVGRAERAERVGEDRRVEHLDAAEAVTLDRCLDELPDPSAVAIRVLGGGTVQKWVKLTPQVWDMKSAAKTIWERGGKAQSVTVEDSMSMVHASAGRHRLVLSASDFQEAKNMEDVAKIKPNTAAIHRTIHGESSARPVATQVVTRTRYVST